MGGRGRREGRGGEAERGRRRNTHRSRPTRPRAVSPPRAGSGKLQSKDEAAGNVGCARLPPARAGPRPAPGARAAIDDAEGREVGEAAAGVRRRESRCAKAVRTSLALLDHCKRDVATRRKGNVPGRRPRRGARRPPPSPTPTAPHPSPARRLSPVPAAAPLLPCPPLPRAHARTSASPPPSPPVLPVSTSPARAPAGAPPRWPASPAPTPSPRALRGRKGNHHNPAVPRTQTGTGCSSRGSARILKKGATRPVRAPPPTALVRRRHRPSLVAR